MVAAEEALAGRWRLVSFELVAADGTTDLPAGEAPRGVLHYGADGWLSVHLAERRRPPWADPDFRNATAAEAYTAVVGFGAYAGTWEVVAAAPDGCSGEVVHRLELCWFPNWEGTEQRRRFALAGDELTLATLPGAQAGATAMLRWRRDPG